MKPHVTWILVADGGQAKIFEHRGPGKGLVAVEGLQFEEEHLQARDIMADRPGRSFSSFGPGSRSAMEYSSDPVAVRERRFVETIAHLLDKKLQVHAFERLIIAAAPTALGDIRPALTPAVREVVMAELPKDLTNLPSPQLERHFAALLPL